MECVGVAGGKAEVVLAAVGEEDVSVEGGPVELENAPVSHGLCAMRLY